MSNIVLLMQWLGESGMEEFAKGVFTLENFQASFFCMFYVVCFTVYIVNIGWMNPKLCDIYSLDYKSVTIFKYRTKHPEGDIWPMVSVSVHACLACDKGIAEDSCSPHGSQEAEWVVEPERREPEIRFTLQS